MRTRSTHLWIAFFSAAAVSLVAVSELGRTSPGALSAVHQREPDLSGKSDCSACHGGLFSTLSEACLECHDEIDQQLEPARGLHGVLGDRVQQCGLCHAEHHGTGSPLVNRQSFALAGVPRLEDFEHERVGFVMDGAHLALACAECHEHANAALLGKDERRYLGLDQDCATCHEDVHQGEFELACASCHGQTDWKELHSLGHERQLPLIGGHAGSDCRECHAQEGAHALERLGGRSRPAPRMCVACHESPHASAFVAGVARSVGLTDGASCVTCHAAEHESFRDERLELGREQHAFTCFALDPPHAQAACADCHASELDFAARYPGRGAEQCSRCHEDVHAGQFEEGPFAGQECTACHAREHFEPHAFTVETHALAALPLTGAHLALECNACHEDPPAGQPRTFHGTPSECAACHADAHDEFFERFANGAQGLPAPEHGSCERCHDTLSFARVPTTLFDHGDWTGFPISGAHEQADCAVCHPKAAERDDTGRTFGRASEHFGPADPLEREPWGCAVCHVDPHLRQFDRQQPGGAEQPRAIEGRSGCARCHVESSFRAFPDGFEHGYWTGFTLAGAHDEARCSACHTPLHPPDALGRTWQPALGAECSACHADPHAGQFQVERKTDCARCHTDELASFLRFDHERDSRFPLGEAHEGVACAACHPRELRGGSEVVRYRPLPAECVDCHGAHEEVLLRRSPRRPGRNE